MNIASVRLAIETLYEDTCDIIERVSIKNPLTKKTTFEEVKILEDYPCKLSFGSIPVTTGDNVAEMVQSVKLFISPDISIAPGSKIIVRRKNGTETAYSNSGKPAIYSNHQEITLELFERWS